MAIYKYIFLILLLTFSVHSLTFCESITLSHNDIQKNKSNEEDNDGGTDESDKLIILGAFASSEAPDTNSNTITYEDTFNKCQLFNIGVVVQKNGADSLGEIKVRYKLFKNEKGPGITDVFFPNLQDNGGIYILSSHNKLYKEGNYTYKIKVYVDDNKVKGYGKIKIKINGAGDCEDTDSDEDGDGDGDGDDEGEDVDDEVGDDENNNVDAD